MEEIKKEKKTADIKAYMAVYNKNYREKNRELTREYSRDYYNRNKDEVKEKLKERVQCECCGATVSKQYLPKHKQRESCRICKIDKTAETDADQIISTTFDESPIANL